MKNLYLFFAALFLFNNSAWAQTAASATWAMTSNRNAVVTGAVTGGTATAGSSVTNWGNATSCGVWGENWSVFSNQVGTNQYVQFTISPTAGNNLTANTFKCHTYATTSSGTCCPEGCDIAAYYSLDGFATAGTLFTGAIGSQGDDGDCTLATQDSYSLGGVSVPNGSTLTVRLYSFSNNDNTDRFYVGNVVINGTTIAACTPPSFGTNPDGTAQNICLNGTSTALNVSATGSGTITYQWYQNTANNNTTGTLIGAATGTSYTPLTNAVSALYYYCVATSSTCAPPAASTVSGLVSVDTITAAPASINGPASVCNLSSNTWSVAPVNTATSYTWTLPTGWTGSSITNSIVGTEGTGGGNITVTANNVCGSSPAQTLAVTITPAPATPGTISGPASACGGDAGTYSITAVSGATSYTWSVPGGWTGVSSTVSINTTAISGGGTISVTANNACGSSTAQTLVITQGTAVPPTPGTIAGPATACSGDNGTYSIASVSGATSYTWSLPNGWSGTSTTESINTTAASGGGTISVTANNNCGSSTAQTFTVSPGATPAQPGTITGPATACSGDAGTYSIVTVSGATSYTWSLPNGWAGTSTTGSINTTAASGGGTISVTANNACGSSAAQTFTVSPGATPAQPGAVTGPATACAGDNGTYSIATVSGATSYTWSLPNGWSGTSVSESINTTAAAGGGTISVTANNACGSSAAQTFTVSPGATPAQPGTITGPATACAGDNGTYSIVTVSGASDYTWTLPNGWTGTSVSESINTVAAAGGGTISVTANNACGSSAAQTLAVSAGATPGQPGTISGPASACARDNGTYSIATVNGATSYTWSLPNGWSGTSVSETINTTAASGGGTISVTANNACGSSSAQTLAVSSGAVPATPGAITGPASACSGDNGTYSIATVNGATSYTWTLPNGWTGNSVSESINTTATGGGTISVTANNACGSSTAQTLTVTAGTIPATPGTITGPASACGGDNGTYSITTVAGATSYTWTLPNGWTGTSTTESINTTATTGGGTISVTANNGCGSSTAQTLVVAAGAVPATPGGINGPDSLCSGNQGAFSVTSVNGLTYTWTLPNGWTGSSTTASLNATAGSTGGSVSVTANNGCGSSTAQTANVVVSPVPNVTFNFGGNPVCTNHSPIALSSGTPAGGTYSGTGVSNNTFDPSNLAAGNYVVNYLYSSAGCAASDTSTIVVQVCSGISNVEASEFEVYPNPFSNVVIINAIGAHGSGMAVLMDATGREIRRTEFDAASTGIQLNTSSIASGVYFLNLIVDGKLAGVKKLFRVE